MSLKRHLSANYASQIYVAAVGILVTPLYLGALGVEAYGLVGFFAMLQVWFLLLDAGLSPAVAREIARHQGGATDAMPVRRLLRLAEWLFVAVALLGTCALVLAAGAITRHWLQLDQLAADKVSDSIRLMAAVCGLRLLASFYRAGVTGFEHLGWLGAFNAGSATAKAFLALPALYWLGGTPEVYFGVQLAIGGIETAWLAWKLRRLSAGSPAQGGDAPLDLRRLGRFSAGVAVTSLLNVALGQSDRLLLSTLLPLPAYSTFMLATLVASAISLVSGPLATVFAPRLARIAGGGDPAALLHAYRMALRLMAAAVFPAACTLAWHAEALLWAWTGQPEVAVQGGPVLALYALGNALSAIAMVAYLLQFALGRLRWHITGSLLFIGLLVPGQWWLTVVYGAPGAGAFWLAVNALWLLTWLPLVHRQLLPAVRWRPAVLDVLGVLAASAVASSAAALLLPIAAGEHRIGVALLLLLAWLLAVCAAVPCLPECRALLPRVLRPLARP